MHFVVSLIDFLFSFVIPNVKYKKLQQITISNYCNLKPDIQ